MLRSFAKTWRTFVHIYAQARTLHKLGFCVLQIYSKNTINRLWVTYTMSYTHIDGKYEERKWLCYYPLFSITVFNVHLLLKKTQISLLQILLKTKNLKTKFEFIKNFHHTKIFKRCTRKVKFIKTKCEICSPQNTILKWTGARSLKK